MWVMSEPGGKLLGHLFHICRDLRIRDDCVEYTDMLLDIWIPASGDMQILDAADLEVAVRAGRISRAEARELTQTVERLAARATKVALSTDA
jgi:predicted RNA-binding protein associated with RNAse of E/G family